MYMLKSKESSQHQSVCVFNIRVSVWFVNGYFKEVGVLKVTFHHNLLEQFCNLFNPYPTAFPYGNGMVLHFYQQQESSTTKTVHKVINKGLKAYV